jgi:RHS repeat-associated protein
VRYKFNGKEEQLVASLGLLDYGARMYEAELGRWYVQDPMAEAYYGTSPYAYCLNNPLRFIDPTGMFAEDFIRKMDDMSEEFEDEAGGMDDWYFSTSGQYLGQDNRPTDVVRVMNPGTDVSRNSDGSINANASTANSQQFSHANISDEAAFNILNHFNYTGYEAVMDNSIKTDMNADYRIQGSGVNGKVTNAEVVNEKIKVNIGKINGNGLLDNEANVVNSFEHEQGHIVGAINDPIGYRMLQKNNSPIPEINAIGYQKNTPTWNNTTYLYKERIEIRLKEYQRRLP